MPSKKLPDQTHDFWRIIDLRASSFNGPSFQEEILKDSIVSLTYHFPCGIDWKNLRLRGRDVDVMTHEITNENKLGTQKFHTIKFLPGGKVEWNPKYKDRQIDINGDPLRHLGGCLTNDVTSAESPPDNFVWAYNRYPHRYDDPDLTYKWKKILPKKGSVNRLVCHAGVNLAIPSPPLPPVRAPAPAPALPTRNNSAMTVSVRSIVKHVVNQGEKKRIQREQRKTVEGIGEKKGILNKHLSDRDA